MHAKHLEQCSIKLGLLFWWASQVAQWERIHLQCRRCGFDSWVGKIPWRRTWQPNPVFLPGESMDWGSWWATVHRLEKSRTWLKWKNTHTQAHVLAAASSAAVNIAGTCIFLNYSCVWIYAQEWDHWIIWQLFFVFFFWGIMVRFSTVAASIYFPTNNVGAFPFLYSIRYL